MPWSSGVLEKCHDLQITPFGNYHQRLKWDPPATLNITAVEPDISSYIVCSNISTECTIINVTEAGSDASDLWQYTFLNLRPYINFTVTAVNIVGNGESASIVSEPCEHTEGGKCNYIPEKVRHFERRDNSFVSCVLQLQHLRDSKAEICLLWSPLILKMPHPCHWKLW